MTRFIESVEPSLAEKVINMKAEDYGNKVISQNTGLSHTPIEGILMEMEYFWNENGKIVAPTAENAAALRDFFQISWGRAAVMMQVPEGKFRKLYEEATGKESQAQRIGHGGRFFAGDARLYEDTLKGSGTEVPVGALGDAVEYASVQKVLKLGFEDLKVAAEELGIEVTNRATPASLAKKVAKALEA
jgi:hypothetical protein